MSIINALFRLIGLSILALSVCMVAIELAEPNDVLFFMLFGFSTWAIGTGDAILDKLNGKDE